MQIAKSKSTWLTKPWTLPRLGEVGHAGEVLKVESGMLSGVVVRKGLSTPLLEAIEELSISFP